MLLVAWGSLQKPLNTNLLEMQVGTGARTKVISTQGLASMRDNIVTIFGSRTFEALTPLDGNIADGLTIQGCVLRSKLITMHAFLPILFL